MDTRREFLKKAALLAGAAGVSGALPASIQKALSIDPATGSTYLDAEHVVFLMQENRSFDHCYGTLQGVRGFNDPRAITLPNQNKVWLQTNEKGETYAPFRLDIKNTNATWMHSLPHSWTNQVDARNNGKYDKWLDVKQSGHDEYKHMPLTMGYYTREDIPFYYALADAFTVCDQNFCSSLTGTTPNRLYFWSGTIRAEQNENSKANVWNEDADYDTMVNWKTYPERLEENGVSWKVYQNDLSVSGGFTDEEDAWMANFGDNPLEYFTQYNVRLSERYINYLQKQLVRLPQQIQDLETKVQSITGKQADDLRKEIEKKKTALETAREEAAIYTKEKYNKLTEQEKNIHNKAFADNRKDPFFYQLTGLSYKDENTEREVMIPKGDILHQFREDVNTGSLPVVSWLVAPENFSDHPTAAWYGAWYLSEVLDILTKNPEVWKKTIFVLNYDENDGYFDHVPPFVAPNPAKPQTGKTSASVDARTEFVSMEQERAKKGVQEKEMRESAIGLGYRVPLVIASPWSRGGWVNSQVFDHTSALQFLEIFLEKKRGKKILELNMSSWRRAVCGDLTSVFRPYNGEKINSPLPVNKNEFIGSIHQAKFKKLPSSFKQLSKQEIDKFNQNPLSSPLFTKQEKGTRPSCALPYELYADGRFDSKHKTFEISFEAANKLFGQKAVGSPFTVYAAAPYMKESLREWSYAVGAGEKINDVWPIEDFENGAYHLNVHGPNGFFREFRGDKNNPALLINCTYAQGVVHVNLVKTNATHKYTIELSDHSYKSDTKTTVLQSGVLSGTVQIDTSKSFGWYDFSVKVNGNALFEQRYAGRVETGKPGKSDPAMGFPAGS
jgi:phospholipase C